MKKIIIADTIKSLLDLDAGFLRRSEIVKFIAASHDEALEIHSREKADIIITDEELPGMPAVDFCDGIRRHEELRQVSIILLQKDPSLAGGACCRANTFLVKPFDRTELLEKTIRLLDVRPRGDFRVPVSLKVLGNSDNDPFLCFSENISSTGMLIDTDRILHNGDVILCSFYMPESILIRTSAEIVRRAHQFTEHDPLRYGIRFTGLESEKKKVIDDFVQGNRSNGTK